MGHEGKGKRSTTAKRSKARLFGSRLGQTIIYRLQVSTRRYLFSGQVTALDLRAQLSRTSVCFRSHTASWIKSVVQACKILGLHNDCMDNEAEEDMADEVDGKNGMVVLSTIIGARTVTLKTVRHAVILYVVRVSYMH